jgi:capsular polysaccharide biosynthesis protein
VSATVVEQAALPDNPVSPQPIRNGLLALMAGLVLGLMLAFLLEYRDDSWRSPEEAEQVSGVPTFGVIRQFVTTAKK